MIEFTRAKRENVSLLIALAGPSGSGKTFSALRLAYGVSPGGKVAFIDTEARRGLHYADRFNFMHFDMKPPFSPARFSEAIGAAEATGAEVVIVDSFSHEHDGEGGIIDMADAIERAGTKSPGNWRVPKGEHKKLVQTILQSRVSIIFCLRADEKIKIEKQQIDGRLKTVIVPMGWTPICEKRFMYEQTTSFTLTDDRPGRPNYQLPHKVQDQHRAFFPDGELIGEEAGKHLAAWARGGDPVPKTQAIGVESAAKAGTLALKAAWEVLTPDQRRAAGGAEALASLKAIAAEADAAAAKATSGPAASVSGATPEEFAEGQLAASYGEAVLSAFLGRFGDDVNAKFGAGAVQTWRKLAREQTEGA